MQCNDGEFMRTICEEIFDHFSGIWQSKSWTAIIEGNTIKSSTIELSTNETQHVWIPSQVSDSPSFSCEREKDREM